VLEAFRYAHLYEPTLYEGHWTWWEADNDRTTRENGYRPDGCSGRARMGTAVRLSHLITAKMPRVGLMVDDSSSCVVCYASTYLLACIAPGDMAEVSRTGDRSIENDHKLYERIRVANGRSQSCKVSFEYRHLAPRWVAERPKAVVPYSNPPDL